MMKITKIAPPTSNGRMFCYDSAGLGVEPDFASLGDPVAVFIRLTSGRKITI
jgi:hypothetical protein